MRTFRVTVNGKSYDVTVEEMDQVRESKPPPAEAPRDNPPPAVKPQPAQQPEAKAEPQNTSGGQKVLAPMPGVVLDLKVSRGDSVKEGDTLLVLEAMKMENEISAPCPGLVKDILVTKGASVNTDDLLVTIE